MRGLTVLVATADRPCAEAAIALACAAAALGARARLYFHDAAVGLLADPPPTLADARTLGVELHACQTGLAAAGLSANALAVSGGGLVSLLATLDDDRLATF